jgi:hypothetical protein
VLQDDCVAILKSFFAEARRRRAEGREHLKGLNAPGLPFDGP